MQDILADRAQIRCRAQRKLLSRKRRDRPFDLVLERFPRSVERRQREIVFSHVSNLLVWLVYANVHLFSQLSGAFGKFIDEHQGPIMNINKLIRS